jgi:ABC-2 type transport system ATP-binding protein
MYPILGIQSLHKSFAGKAVLNDINLQLPGQGIHGLVGLNGAGKTTLLKCMLDLQRPDRGEIRIRGISSIIPAARDTLVYLPERFAAPDYMSGWTYLKFIIDAHLPAARRKAAHAGVESLCAKLDLAIEALDKPVQSLSKGMLQKLAITGCLLSEKELLILDEPTSGLDPKARFLFKKVIEELRQEGRTVLMCSHILPDIEALCEQTTILHAGRILFSGTAQGCCAEYATPDFESAFLKCIEGYQ